MIELTHETMPSFLEGLRTLLGGRMFDLRMVRGRLYRGMRLKQAPAIERFPNGLWQIQLNMGVVKLPFTTYFARCGEEPLVMGLQTARVRYEFTGSSVKVFIEYLHPSLTGQQDTLCIMLGRNTQ